MRDSADQRRFEAAFGWGAAGQEPKFQDPPFNASSGDKRAYASHPKERRSARRYPLKLDLTYSISETRAMQTVAGATSDLSSRSILFTAEALPPVGSMIEAQIAWPVQIGGEHPLRLVVFGPVLKRDTRGAVMLIKRYGFASEGAGQGTGSATNRSTGAHVKSRRAH
jgi:hypothetical protein